MFAVVAALCLMGLSPSLADHHQACHSPNMTGTVAMSDLRNGAKVVAEFVYDPLARKLRMKTAPWPGFVTTNSSRNLDLLLLFDQGVFYEIDSKNQSCEKKVLHSAVSSMEVPPSASFSVKTTLGSETVAGEGLTLSMWKGTVPKTQGTYCTAVTEGCMPVSTTYTSNSSIIIVSHIQVETEIKDPEKLCVPSFCEGEEVDTTDGSSHTFFNLLF
ncbi:ependymin-like [Gadus chalcogrammus]|uniref:ependymin-like n=1 Tax=Gadus chalcogrammus TaxID=1042646 RepID=UPI0024C2BDC1|nr:ependymin-like [Gadus chalcogrammus]XP_056449551.1 ependymin-like [Gadus chalcogrammus]